jgi:hypothetical protein
MLTTFKEGEYFYSSIFVDVTLGSTHFDKKVILLNCAFTDLSKFSMSSLGPDCIVKFVDEPLLEMPIFNDFGGLDSILREKLEVDWEKTSSSLNRS